MLQVKYINITDILCSANARLSLKSQMSLSSCKASAASLEKLELKLEPSCRRPLAASFGGHTASLRTPALPPMPT